MGRVLTWLILGAVVALAGAAAVDAIRDGRDVPGRPATSETLNPVQEEAKRERAVSAEDVRVSGLLVYADPSCRVFALGLTALRPHVPSGVRSCGFRFSPGDVLSFGRELLSPRHTESARCRGGQVELLVRQAVVARFRGCTPAWKPDGTLTFVSSGEVVAVGRCAAVRCQRSVLSRSRLGGAQVASIAWLTNDDGALILRQTGDRDVLVLLEGDRIVARSDASTRFSRLRSSPTGRYVAAASRRPAGLVLFDRQLRSWSFVERARAITWSPDERLAAVVTRGGMEIVGAVDLDVRFRLGFRAVDVAWR